MRLRNWIAVVVSVILLAAAGTIGFLVNRSALRAADAVHRADTTALGTNNGTLTGQMQLLSAKGLDSLAESQSFSLSAGNSGDRATLQAFAAKSGTFSYGVLITDLTGAVLNASRDTGLPTLTDPGWEPLRKSLAAGRPGFSSIMTVNGVHLEAVAVPIVVSGAPVAILVGLNNVAETDLQKYTLTLKSDTFLTTIVDSTGTVAASGDPRLLGTKIDPAVRAEIAKRPASAFLRYTALDNTKMIAIVIGNLPGGWAYVRSQTQSSYDGAVHSKSQTLNLTLLAMLLIGVAGIAVLGYRGSLQRRRAHQRFEALFQHAPDLVSVLDAHGRIAYSSPSAIATLGFGGNGLVGDSVFDLVHPEDRPIMVEQFGRLLASRDAVLRLQCRVRSADGRYRWFEFTASNQMQNPSLNGVVINARDISETRAFQERLAHEAQHDALTGLPNRRRMQDVLDSTLRQDAVAVLFVDLDGFKPVNDAHGHEAGDELLRQVAQRLSACVREQDVLARVGGDEFVVLMPGVLGWEDAESMADRIRRAVEQPFVIDGGEVLIGASVGLHVGAPAEDADEVLRAADHAMYTEKKSGNGRRNRATPVHSVRAGRHRAEA
ncbi:diguanylate cyclase [Actinoplanes sp. NPDC051411]|uniref:diguanylate cyclase domain-containing protein n=1 Tax=Actinoplanes sp. NPDC051411 TaxID=3155522 RepID=UPI003443DE21